MQVAALRRTSRILCLAAVLAHPSRAQTILGFTAASSATPAQIDSWYQDTQARTTADIDRASKAPWPEVSTMFDLV